ncbi:DNA repair protein complementing XP-C cells isoform X1 [Syngnathus typhle]|uniref:DNA repair protein complementing XP-C cells isoform X1 n=1 Tax=Syngnathus typhle TaxID=161592 RepID=UPI002A69EFA0|nr:DNA repair protein complementing XP-C cells isoform X1 [Syngnathus typhle]
MAKRRSCKKADVDTKKLKQVPKAKGEGTKVRAKRKDAGDDEDSAKEEKMLKKRVNPKPRSSSGHRVGNTVGISTSKHVRAPVKREETHSTNECDEKMSSAALVTHSGKEEEESEEEEDDWEEVEELAEPLSPAESSEPALPSQPVEIEIETPEVRKKQKKRAEFEMYLRRMMNRYKKDLLVDTHKVHLMCLLASGMFRNRLCSEPDLLAITLSMLPAHFSAVAKERKDQNYLSGLLKWFQATFTLNPSLPYEERPDPRTLLEKRLASLSAKNHQEMTHIFLLVLRSLQLFCRLVLSLQPLPLKPPSAKISSHGKCMLISHQGKGATTSSNAPAKTNQNQVTSKISSLEQKVSRGSKRPAEAKSAGDRGGKRAKRKPLKGEEAEKILSPGGPRPKNSKRRSIASKVTYKEESNSEGEEEVSDEDFQQSSEEDSEDSEIGSKTAKIVKGKERGKSKNDRNNTVQKKTSGLGKDEENHEDGEKGQAGSKAKRQSTKKKNCVGADQWVEVFVDKTSSWVCVDVEHGVGAPQLCSQNATRPITYVVGVDEDGFVKDLGRKYDPTWMTSSRKRRVEEEWWEETLQPFLRPEDEQDIKEEKEMQKKLLNKPLPVSIAEYKNHPLYALKRHLLKYEAIYPDTAAILGYCRGEPVYSRDCVHTLHSKDTWLKEARTVRIGEVPYKMVKGFSNRSRKARMMTEQKDDNDLALFGEWQTEVYQPPIAVNGKVPRNDYGNVYLFKASMLPVGCVHLRLSNLHRVAKKLDMDAAPAVTGFDFHGGYSHAVTDGYIVCEENEEILRAAWLEEQELQKQREKEKREKRVISNWTLLVKGLQIRERLKRRYGKKGQAADEDRCDGLSSDEGGVEEEENSRAKTATETLAMSWPQNRQAKEEKAKEEKAGSFSGQKTKRERRGKEKHLFPFEKA